MYRTVSVFLFVLSLVLRPPSVAAAAPGPDELAQFRGDFSRYIQDMQDLVASAADMQQGRAASQLARSYDSLDYAQDLLNEVDDEQLAEAYAAFERYPSAWSVPAQLHGHLSLLERQRILIPRSGRKAELSTCADGQLVPCDSCPPNATPTARSSVSTWFIAKGVSVVTEAIYEPIADAISIPIPFVGGSIRVPSPIKIILGIIHFAAKGVALGFETAINVHVRCEDFAVRHSEKQFLDETISSRASSEAVGALQDAIDAFTAEAELLDIEAIMALRSSKDAVAFYQLPVNSKISDPFIGDTTRICAAMPDAARDLDSVQECTQNSDCAPLPGETEGICEASSTVRGRLEKTRLIVADSIDRLEAIGQDIGSARKYLRSGDERQAAERWVQALEFYRQAYRQALTLHSGDKQ